MTLRDKIQHRKYLNIKRNNLYKDYEWLFNKDNPYCDYNKKKSSFVIYNILSNQILQQNSFELKALQILSNRGIDNVKYQELIPILSEGGKLEHLYVADIVIGNTIIEIDGKSHDSKKQEDEERDRQILGAGYITKRFSTSDIDKLRVETFI